jgi:hypothetical protein
MLRPERSISGRWVHLLAAAALSLGLSGSLTAQDVLTWRNDNQRTGQYLGEATLTPASVSSGSFGKLFSQATDGSINAQPLYKSNVSIAGKGNHNVVFVVTNNNSVYAFDADSNSGANASPLWQAGSFGASSNSFGITGTPAIDPVSGTLYCVARTSESGTFVHRLHALDIGSGAEKFGGPVVIQASVPGTGDGSSGGTLSFSSVAVNQLARPGVLLSNGVVYLGWGGPGDVPPYHGWVMAYNASTLAQTAVYCDTPNASAGGIWMAGALSADSGGTVFATSGNGSFDTTPGGQHGNSVVKLSGGLSVEDYFTPANSASDNSMDLDLGGGGCLILPDQPGPFPHLLVQGGKPGILRLLNRDNLGQFNGGGDQVVQALSTGMILGTTPAYFSNGASQWIYLKDCIGYDNATPLKQYQLSGGLLSGNPVSQSSASWGNRSGSPVVSANGTSNGLVWAIQASNPAVLRAWDATNLNNLLYDSSGKASDNPGPGINFTSPTIANGKVYVGTATGLACYGFPGSNPPSITMQPANQTVVAGQTATFTVAASGTAPLSYQWQKDGTAIAGATGASYTTPATTTADSGSTFRCVVSNSAGSATSNSATLTVTTATVAPTITTQPSNQIVTAGQTATFSVAASGSAPLSYQWQKNGTTITGATGASYTTPATTTADSGSTFRCLVTNSAGSATSTSATLTVKTLAVAPTITAQPSNQTVTDGQTATFTVSATGTAPLSYQWQKDGTAIAGATGASYTTPATTTADSGSTFRCVVSNSAGSATSNSATLTVNPAAPAIVTPPANQSVTLGQTATFSVVAKGTAPLSYQWQKNGTTIAGATGTSYTTPNTTAADDGATFRVVVSNSAGSVTSAGATLTVNTPPSIVAQPTNASTGVGRSVTFSVVASGTAPLSYQWQKNGANIAGATGASYTTPAVTQADGGSTYRVMVTNVAGSVMSESAMLFFDAGFSAKGACGLLGLEGFAVVLLALAARRLRCG